MIFITEKSLRQNAKKFGFKEFDNSIVSLVNKGLESFLKNKLSKVQKGGRTVLPSEYFGVESGSYFDKVSSTDLSVTDSIIRPPVLTKDLSGLITGGALKFTVAKSVFKNAVVESQSKLHRDSKLDSKLVSNLQDEFHSTMSEIFSKLQKKKLESLNREEFKKVFEQRKYKLLH